MVFNVILTSTMIKEKRDLFARAFGPKESISKEKNEVNISRL